MARRRIGQESFGFAGRDRGGNAALEELAGAVDWAPVERLLGGVYASARGEPAWPPLALMKALLLGLWHDLSDVKLAEALDDRRSFRRFCGFAESEAVPERTAFVRFRRELVRRRLERPLFRAVLRQLEEKGLVVKTGTLVDATVIQANLAEVGITVNIVPLDGGPFWEMGMESKGDQWKELEIWLMRYTTTPDPYEATQWFTSDQVGVWNWERWTSEEFDRLYDEGIAETDEAKRDEIYVRMQEIMEETGAYVWINHDPSAYVHRADLDISVAPSGEQDYRRFE